jgi:hypothetical protein
MAPVQRRDGFRWGRVVLVVVALLIINVPYALHTLAQHRVASDGVLVQATVVSVAQAGDDMIVTFRLPKSVDPDQAKRLARVHDDVGVEAARSKEADVRVLAGHPGSFHLVGQINSRSPLILTLVADALIGLMLLLSWRLGGRLRRPKLVGIAVEDVQSGEPGSLLDRQDDGTYIVNGEVVSASPESLVLVLRDRDVEIHLRDHQNPIAVGERARVRAHLVG